MIDHKIKRSESRVNVLLIYFIFMILFITLYPFQFKSSGKIMFNWYFYISGFVYNILFFMPVGFFLRMGRYPGKFHLGSIELIFGILFSLFIELLQTRLAFRVTAGYDLLANSLGAWIGAWGFQTLTRGFKDKKISGIFFLDLPLAGFIYLLTPLIWLNGLSAEEDPHHMLLGLLPALIGIFLLKSVYKNTFLNSPRMSENKFSLIIITWLLVSVSPAALYHPKPVIIALILLSVSARILLFDLKIKPSPSKERRYELRNLKRILPLFVLFILLLFLLPSPNYSLFQLKIKSSKYFKTFYMLRFMEQLGACSILGYLIAEMRGRIRETLLKKLGLIALSSIILSAAWIVVRRYPLLKVNTWLGLFIIMFSSLLGALIYHHHLAGIIRHPKKSERPT